MTQSYREVWIISQFAEKFEIIRNTQTSLENFAKLSVQTSNRSL